MYLYGVFSLGLAALVATTWLQLASVGIVAGARHVAERYANVALERAQDDLMESLALQVAASGPRGPFVAPTPGPPQPACAAPPCAFLIATQAQLSGQTAVTLPGDAVAANVQQNAGVGEQRVAALLTVTIANAGGAVFGRAVRRVTLRTFAVAPYVALSGVDEAVAANPNVADFAGTCDGNATCGGVDNRIHALLRCHDPVTPANCAGQPYRQADTFSSNSWQNGNATTDSWSR
jgi:hypothetical protein